MAQYNESVWGTSSEIVRLNYANTVSPWIPEPQDNLYRSKYSVLNTPMNAGTFPNNWNIDLSFATVNIDANCPWSFVHYINRDNNFIDDGGEMSLLPWFYNGDYGGLCGWISANPGTKLRVSTTSNSNSTPTMRYYQYLGQYNTSRQVYPHWTSSSYRDQIYMPIQRSTAIVKLGGRSIVGQIRVRCKNSRTSTSIQEYTLKEYCDTRYSSYPYIVGVAIVYAWRGQTYATLDRHSVIFAALSKDINIKVGSDTITVSSWDKELNGDNANGYNNIFGNMAATAQMDTSTDYLYPIFDERTDITGGWCATNYQDFGTIKNFHDEMMKSAAYHGTFFTDTAIPYSNSIPDWLSDNMYCGVIDQNGVTHGEYTRGIRNIRNFQYDSENVSIDSNVTPKRDGGGGPEKPTSDGDKDAEDGYIKGSGTHFTSISLDDIGLQRYIVTKSDFDNLYEYLNQCLDYPNAYKRFLTNGADKGISSDILKQIWSENFPTAAEYTAYIFSKLGYSNDPRANIVSLMLVPFKLTETQTSRRIRLGDGIVGGDFEIYIPTGASTIEEKVVYAPASTFTPSEVKGVEKTVEIIWTGNQNYTIEHPEKWNDFRAFPPYTRAELTIPFHGTIELDPSIAIGKNLSIVLLLDTITGASIANVRLDGELYASIPGQCGFNVPFSVDASSMTASGLMGLSAQSQVNKLSQQRNSLTGAMTVASSLANGNPAGAIEGIASTIISNKELGIYESAVDFNIQHATDGRIVSNAASALVSFGMPISPRITWHLPLSLGFTNSEYGRTVGFACAKTGKISNFSGYTEFSNADLSTVTATEQEKAMILAQLQNGIII